MKSLHEHIATLIESVTGVNSVDILGDRDVEVYVTKLINRAELVTWFDTGILCAFVAFYANDPSGEAAFISMVAVAPTHQRKKLANSLLAAVLTNLRARNFSKCRLEVHPGNLPAIALYESLGFHRVRVDDRVLFMEASLQATSRT